MSFKNVIRIENKKRVSGITKPVNYSTEEHIIGTWIDGSTLYEKTISNISLPNASSVQVPHNISNLNKVIEITGCFTNNAGTSYNPLPYIDIDGIQYCVRLNVYSSVILIITGDDFSAYKADVTLRYTKTS